MPTDREVARYRLLGATEEDVHALHDLPAREAAARINARVCAKIGQLVAGTRIRLQSGKVGMILSQYVTGGIRWVRVRWDETGRANSRSVDSYFGVSVEGFDDAVAAADAFEKRVFTAVHAFIGQHGMEQGPPLHDLRVQKIILRLVREQYGTEATDEDIHAVIRRYTATWHATEAAKFRRRMR